VVGLILLWNLVSTPSEEITQIDSKWDKWEEPDKEDIWN
jgi:hypothetical protein